VSNYRKRWLREHPRVCIYLSKEEHELLKRLADKLNRTYKETLMAPFAVAALLGLYCRAELRTRSLGFAELEVVALRCPHGEVELPRSTYEKLREIVTILPEPG